jgi:hypothetical protein
MDGAKIIEGVGFGIVGYEDNYLELLGGDRRTSLHVGAADLVPEAARVEWSRFEALTGGFSPDTCAEVLARKEDGGPPPRAVRVRITVEHELLSVEETERLLERLRAQNLADAAENARAEP